MKRWRSTGRVLIIASCLFGASLLIPAVREQLKQWGKQVFGSRDGWSRMETQLNEHSHMITLKSPPLAVNGLHPSMTGPASTHYFQLREGQSSELLWMTGFSTSVVRANGDRVGDNFLCHNNLDYALGDYCSFWQLQNREGRLNARLATITQGQPTLHFPEGFGIPLLSDLPLSTSTQALNLNDSSLHENMQHEVAFWYTEDHTQQLKPLFQQSVSLLVEVDTTQLVENDLNQVVDCSPALPSIAFLNTLQDGKTYTGHWMIPVGKDTLSYEVTSLLNLPFNTTLHMASIHVHPFCETILLKDLTTGDVIIEAQIQSRHKDLGLHYIPTVESIEGIPMYTDHRYELTCITNNTSDAPQDMMAVLLLYLYDEEMEEKVAAWR